MRVFSLEMSRSLVVEANPRVVSENATREEVDIDHVAINIPIGHEEAANTIKAFTGNTILLSTKRGRHWHREAWNFLVLCWNPIIILTMLTEKSNKKNYQTLPNFLLITYQNWERILKKRYLIKASTIVKLF